MILSPRTRSTLLAVLALLFVGCDREPMIRVYEVELRQPGMSTATSDSSQAKPKRMLAAIIPVPQQSIFLKLMGDPDAVGKCKNDVETIAKSVTMGGDGTIQFEVPIGWQRAAGSGMAAATVSPPDMAGIDAAMTVTPLTRPTDAAGWTAHVQQNLDRWRGQLGLSNASVSEQAENELKTVPSSMDGLLTYIVDYSGTSAASSMMPPFMRNTTPAANTNLPGEPIRNQDSATEVPSKNTDPKVSDDAMKLSYSPPDGWIDEAKASNSIRLASLKTDSTELAADVSVISAGGDERSIAELWTKSVFGGKADITSKLDQILADAQSVTSADGVAGKLYWVHAGADQQSGTTIAVLAAVFPVSETVGDEAETNTRKLFAKMSGPATTVAGNREKFASFVESLRW